MQKVDLKKVLDMLINEEQYNAEELLHQWFVEKTKVIHESLMQEDDVLELDDLTKGIEDDQDEVKAEEYYGEDEEEEDDDDDPAVDALAADNAKSSIDDVSFDTGDSDGVEMPGDDVPGDAEDSFTGDPQDMTTDPDAIKDQFNDLQSDLARLKAEFEKIVGGEEGGGDEEDPNAMMPMDEPAPDSPADTGDDMAIGGGPPEENMGMEDDAFESDLSDLKDLGESWELEKVPDAGLTSSKYSGTGGKTSNENDTSLISGKVKPDVYANKPIKFGGEEKGNYLGQNPPSYKKQELRKNQVSKANANQEKVDPKGPSGALLNNKGEGFGSDKVKNFVQGGPVRESSPLKRK